LYKEKPLEAELILSMFRQPIHVLGINSSIIRIGLDWIPIQKHNRQSSKKNNKYQLFYTYGCASGWCFFTQLHPDAQTTKHKILQNGLHFVTPLTPVTFNFAVCDVTMP